MSSGMVTESQPAPGPNGTPPSGQGRSPVASRMDARAALKAALEKGEDAEAPATDSPAPGPTDERSNSEGGKAASTDETKSTAPERQEAKPAEKPDAETEKRLAKVQDAEKRSREKLDVERKAHAAEVEKFAAERKALDAQREEFEAFQKLKAKAKLDPAAALRALGVEDLEYAAKQAYAQSKAKLDDPKNREAAAREMRDREYLERLEAAEKRTEAAERRAADVEKLIKDRDESASIQQKAAEYMTGVMKAADANPLAKHVIGTDPEHANQRLRRIAYDLAQELDDVPDAEDVIARFEQEERKALARYGVDPNSILSAPTTKKNEPSAEKKNAAPTLSNDLTTPRVARTRETERERRASVLAELEKLSG